MNRYFLKEFKKLKKIPFSEIKSIYIIFLRRNDSSIEKTNKQDSGKQ